MSPDFGTLSSFGIKEHTSEKEELSFEFWYSLIFWYKGTCITK